MSETMTIMQAAHKWKLSPNWVRELITSGRVPATLMKGPIRYYAIPANSVALVEKADLELKTARRTFEQGAQPTDTHVGRRIVRRKPGGDYETVTSGGEVLMKTYGSAFMFSLFDDLLAASHVLIEGSTFLRMTGNWKQFQCVCAHRVIYADPGSSVRALRDTDQRTPGGK